MKWNSGSDFSTGGFLREPGGYHFIVSNIEENPTKKGGQLIDNAAFRVTCEVQASTVPGTENKTAELLFFFPKPGGKNDGAFARKKIDRFFLAVNLMSEEDAGKEGLDIDLQKAMGRQFKCNLELRDGDGDKKYLDIAFTDIFHVDDPAAKAIPANPEMLALIAPSLRRIGSQPAKKDQKKEEPKKNPAEQKKAAEEFDL